MLASPVPDLQHVGYWRLPLQSMASVSKPTTTIFRTSLLLETWPNHEHAKRRTEYLFVYY